MALQYYTLKLELKEISLLFLMKTVEKEVAISEEHCLRIIKVHLILNC